MKETLKNLLDQRTLQTKLGIQYQRNYVKQKSFDLNEKKVRISQDKANFFECQINKLHYQNVMLKEQVITINKSMSKRANQLIDIINKQQQKKQNNMTIEEAINRIKQEWKQIYQRQASMKYKIMQLNKKVYELNNEMNKNNMNHENQIRGIMEENRSKQQKYKKVIQEMEEQKCKLSREYKMQFNKRCKQIQGKIYEIQKQNTMIQLLRNENNKKSEQNRENMKKYKQNVEHLLQDFQNTKKNLIIFYEKQNYQKLQSCKKQWELNNKLQNLQKFNLIAQYGFKDQQYHKRIAEKDYNIQKLTNQINSINIQINTQRNQLSAKNKQNQTLNNQLNQLKTINQRQRAQISNLQNKILKMKEDMKEKENMVQNNKAKLQNERLEMITHNQKLKYEMELIRQSQKNQKINFDLRINKHYLELNQKVKQYEYKLKYLQNQSAFKFEQLNKSKQAILVQKNQVLQLLEAQNKNKSELMSLFELTVQKHNREIEKKLKNQQLKHENIVEEYQNKTRKLQISHKTDILNLQQEISRQKMRYMKLQQSIEVIKSQFMKQKQETTKNHVLQLQTLCLKLKESYKQIIDQKEKQIKDLKIEKDQIINYLQTQLKQKIKEIQIIDLKKNGQNQSIVIQIHQKYKQIINNLKQEHCKQVQKLKNQFDQTKNKIVVKFEEQIEYIKSQNQSENLKLKYQTEIQSLNKMFIQEKYNILLEHQNQKKQIQIKYQNQIQQINSNYQNQIIQITKRLQFDIIKINDLLLSQKSQHLMTKMTKQQKINYLITKINELKTNLKNYQDSVKYLQNQMKTKEKMILDLQLDWKNKMAQKQKQYSQLQNQFYTQLQNKLKQKTHQFSIQIKQKQSQFLQFSNKLYDHFQNLKKNHDELIKIQKIKYIQLQTILLDRPSRNQDLNIIKKLREDKQFMNKILQQEENKVKQSNEIVKYLQLELENYKQLYDIFGPPQIPPEEIMKNKIHSQSEQIRRIPPKKSLKNKVLKTELQQLARNKQDFVNESKELLFPIIRINTVQNSVNRYHESDDMMSNANKFLNSLEKKQRVDLFDWQSSSNNEIIKNKSWSRRKLKMHHQIDMKNLYVSKTKKNIFLNKI